MTVKHQGTMPQCAVKFCKVGNKFMTKDGINHWSKIAKLFFFFFFLSQYILLT